MAGSNYSAALVLVFVLAAGFTYGQNKCDKCNIPVSSGGCTCNSNCDCLAGTGGGTSGGGGGGGGSGSVQYSGSGSGTYYYDLRTTCPSEPGGYPETNGYPSCASFTPGPNQQTIRQVGSNNIIAIDNGVLSANCARLCGKKVLVFSNGKQVFAPDGGDFFVWDGCAACARGVRIDFSVSGLRNVNSNACNLGVVPGVTWQVVDQQVKTFVS